MNVTKLTTLQSNKLTMINTNPIEVGVQTASSGNVIEISVIPASTANHKIEIVPPDPLKVFIANKKNVKKKKPTAPVTCDQCGNVYKRKEFLARHMVTHQGLRPFKCDQPNCDKAFSRKEYLMQHIVSHSGEKVFRCEQCHKVYARKHNLIKHKRSHEAKAKKQQQKIQIQQQLKENTEDSLTISAK